MRIVRMHQMWPYNIQVYLYPWLVYNLPDTNFWNETILLYNSRLSHTTWQERLTAILLIHITWLAQALLNTPTVKDSSEYSSGKNKRWYSLQQASLPLKFSQHIWRQLLSCANLHFAAISVFCMFPFLSQQHQLQTEQNISAPSPTLQGCSLVCVTMSSLTDQNKDPYISLHVERAHKSVSHTAPVSQDSSVSIVTRGWAGQSGNWILIGVRQFSLLQKCPYQLWGPPSLLFRNVYIIRHEPLLCAIWVLTVVLM
jgi:hypothetical protein